MKKSTELELKLAVSSAETLEKIEKDGIFSGSEAKVLHLAAKYYDLASGELQRSKASLRFRTENGIGKVTFKTKGKSSGGVFARAEWETEASDIFDGVAKLKKAGAEELARVGAEELVLVTEAEFTRRELSCRFEGAELCMAFDSGWLGGEDNTFCEVEAELVSGGASALEALGKYLSEKYSLVYEHESKRARCERYRLSHTG